MVAVSSSAELPASETKVHRLTLSLRGLLAIYAVIRADAVVVPVNPINRGDEFGHSVTDPETTVVICAA